MVADPSRDTVRVHAKKLGEILQERELINQEQFDQALRSAIDTGRKLGEVLVDQGLITPLSLLTALSSQLNVPIVDLKRRQISPEVTRLVPEEIARRYRIQPLDIEDGSLLIATTDPLDMTVLEDLRARVRMRIKPLLALDRDIEEAITQHYRATSEIEKQISQISPAAVAPETERVSREVITSSPLVRAVDLIISQAVKDRASDVHLEPQRESVRVRYRIDGILHDVMTLPSSVHAAMLSRIKIMAGMNIAERRRPQDGQFSVHVGSQR